MKSSHIAVVGDTHGHLQLALCVLAQWQLELNIRFEAVLLAGDVGTFTEDSQLDNATRRHGRTNPCELEFLQQWSRDPQPPWIEPIFLPVEDGGLGIVCPVIMVHGNHEGFDHLSRLDNIPFSAEIHEAMDLPEVDTGGNIRYLPSGCKVRLPSGIVIAGVGGIERGQRRVDYHSMAYIDDDAVTHLLSEPRVDIMLTHEGPARVQGEEKGSVTFDMLLEARKARLWFHGHSTPHPDIVDFEEEQLRVVPLGDIAFPKAGNEPGADGWVIVENRGGELDARKETPIFLRTFRRHKWIDTESGLVSPSLARFANAR